VARNLAGQLHGVPERFVPDEMRGELIEAEHLARYWWAARLVEGKRVLDAGCGVGYGSSILAGAGAAEVVGVDISDEVLQAVRHTLHPGVRLERADVRKLPFDEDSFDVVVSFELIEHLARPAKALDEFVRVMRSDGLLVLSSPNRDVYPEGNPHHQHEFRHDELRAALSERFEHVELYRQLDWVTSAIFDDDTLARGSGDEVEELTLRKVAAEQPGSELYTLALASHAPLPEPRALAVLGDAAQIRPWLSQLADQDHHINILRGRLDAMSERQAELRRLLLDAHAGLAERDEHLLSAHRNEMHDREQEILWLRKVVRDRERELDWLRSVSAERDAQLERMAATRIWKAGERYWRLKRRLRLGG
jgi:SAM-dependent methyltransferase